MATWQDISNDPDYQGLPDTEKRKVADGFFSKTISADPDYTALPSEEQQKVRFGFYAKTGFNAQENAKETFMQKLGRATTQMIGPDTAAGHMANDILRIPGSEKLTQPVFGAISKGIGKVQDAIAGNPTVEALAAPFQTALEAGKGIADFMAPAGIGAADLLPIASKLRFLAKAPAAIRAVEVAKVQNEVGQDVFKAATEALTPEELSSITGTAEKAKAATFFVPPAGWKSTAPIGSAPAPTATGKPFTLQAGLGADNQAALEAFRAKLPAGPEITPPLAQVEPQAIKAAPVPVPASAPVMAQGKGFAGNINLTKYPKPVADLINTGNKALGFAERASQTVPELKAIGNTPEAQDLFKKLTTMPEGSLAGGIDQARNQLAQEGINVLSQIRDITKMAAPDIENISKLAKQAESISKAGKAVGQGLSIFKQNAHGDVAKQFINLVETQKTQLLATKSPFVKPMLDTLTTLEKAASRNAFDMARMTPIYRTAMKVSDVLYEVYLSSILSGPYTHLRNNAGNIIMAGLKPIETAGTAAIQKIIRNPGAEEKTFTEAAIQLKALAKGLINPVKTYTGEYLPFSVMGAESKIEQSALKSTIGGKTGKILSVPLTALQKEDNFFKNLVGYMEYSGLQSKGVTGEELMNRTKLEALYRTFQNESSKLTRGAIELRDAIPGAKFVLPFVKTPLNLMERGLERSPAGALKVIGKSLSEKGYIGSTSFAHDLSNAIMGSGVAGFLGYQFSKGKISGSYPTDKTEREIWQAQGKTPYSVLINGRWIPLDNMEPVGTIIKSTIAAMEGWQDSKEENISGKAEKISISLGKSLGNQSALQGFGVLARSLSEPERFLGKTVDNVAAGFVPSASKFIADLSDPYARAKKGIAETAKAKVPGLSQTLPPQRDALGNPIKKDMFWGAKSVETPELDFAKSLGVTLPDTKKIFQPTSPISTQEQDSYRLFVGVRIKGLLQQEMQNPSYADPFEEKKFLENQMRDYADTGRAIAIANAELRDLGINISATPEQAVYLYKTVLHDKRYKPLSKDQRREVINRIILGGKT